MSNFIYYGSAIVCFISAVSIATFKRDKNTFKRWYGVLAIVLATAFFSVAVRSFFGMYGNGSTDISEFAVNIFYCVVLIVARGNVAKLVRPEQTAKPPKQPKKEVQLS